MNPETYLAHLVLEPEAAAREQTLSDHLTGVAALAEFFAGAFQAREWGRLAGMWHDVGKFSVQFQEYLLAAVADEEGVFLPRTDHSSAGAQHAARALGAAGMALAYAIAGHHAGLLDGEAVDAASLQARLRKPLADWSACPASILDAQRPPYPFTPPERRQGFHTAFFIRMLFSCLVDADFLDTERFMDRDRAAQRGRHPELAALKADFDRNLNAFLADKDSAATPLNRCRSDILAQCRAAAERERGLFSLSVPTGGGKTLSSMAFALDHAAAHGMERIIYVMPFTSIIEQNARVFRDFLSPHWDAVLEHHSSYDPEDHDIDSDDNDADPGDRNIRGRLATENWDAPVIVTTAVQFFESLFAKRTSRCRKLHNLADSVIVLDEAQTLPRDFLEPCLAALRELTSYYGASVVLCTATQPALDRREDFPEGLEGVREIIPDAQALALAPEFRRVRFVIEPEPLDDATLAGRLADCGQALCIVNTRRHARAVYAALREQSEGGEGVFHLSGNMCAAHRSEQLGDIRERLRNGARCIVVSTSLIEAGVDVSFPAVFRAMAGLDQIIQAAGRCNREGADAFGTVHVFTPRDESLPPFLAQPAAATSRITAMFGDRFDPLDPAITEAYFRELFWTAGPGLDRHGILPDFEQREQSLLFPFATVAEKFRIIPDTMMAVIVPYDSTAKEYIEDLRYAGHPGGILRRLQPYTVQISPRLLPELFGFMDMVHDQYPVLRDLAGCYDPSLGLDMESLGRFEPDALITSP